MRVYRRTYKDKKTGRRKRVQTYTLEYWSRGKQHQVPLKTRDKAVAHRLAAEHMRRVDLHRGGIPFAGAERTKNTTMAHLIDQYEASLRRRGRTDAYVQESGSLLRRMVTRMNARWITDCTAEAIEEALEDFAPAAATRNKARSSVGRLFRWLQRKRRWSDNPVTSVDLEDQPPSRERRPLTADELHRLLEILDVEDGPRWRQKRARRALYATAAFTGLRRSELQRLRRSDIDFKAGNFGAIRVDGSRTKNRKDAALPIPQQLRSILERHLEDTKGRPFPSAPNMKTWYRDLERAGIEKDTDAGRADFHSLRQSFATMLVRDAGAPLKIASDLMRHADPRTTSKLYTKLGLNDHAEWVDRLPLLLPRPTPVCGDGSDEQRQNTDDDKSTAKDEQSHGG